MLIEHGPDGPNGRNYRIDEVHWLDVNMESVEEMPQRWQAFEDIIMWCHSGTALVSVGYPAQIAYSESSIPGEFSIGFPQMSDLLLFKITFGGRVGLQQSKYVDGHWTIV